MFHVEHARHGLLAPFGLKALIVSFIRSPHPPLPGERNELRERKGEIVEHARK